jgi:UDP-N-acetylglucosamine--N-acetylmuramyl-(pentapeptide) pyrophosphoryl-undecaprenol N-acetylglucosamine transferase
MRLVIAGGGTGGHLFPGIAVAEALKEMDPSSEVLFVGTERGIETREVPKAGFVLELIEVGGLKRVGPVRMAKTLVALPTSLLASRRILKRFGAEAVLGVGGYASGPVLLAAALMGLPTAICEQNSVPGFTNRVLSRLVRKVFLTFEGARGRFPAPEKCELVGNPVRASFRHAAHAAPPEVERGLVFTFGGSQGARALNEALPEALALVKARGHDVRALHQAGKSEADDVRARYAERGVEADVRPFLDDMVQHYRRADVVVCRAGASSCTELTALGVPAILVPFPFAADDHQTLNARDLSDQGAAVLLPHSELSPERLADEIERLLKDRDGRADLARRARDMGRLDAAERVLHSAMAGFPAAAGRRAQPSRAEEVPS